MRYLLLAATLCAACQRTLPGPTDGGPPPDLTAADLAGAPLDLASADLVAPPPTDLAPSGDLAKPPGQFPFQLEGIWLIGWSGGLDHFSWVRFHWIDAFSGTIDVLDPMGKPGWTPYWQTCQGMGKVGITQKPDTVQFFLPNGCMPAQDVMTFVSFQQPMGFPPGAILTATIQGLNGGQNLEGYKFPDNQCDVNFTMCKLP